MSHSLFMITVWNLTQHNLIHCVSCYKITCNPELLIWGLENLRPFFVILFVSEKWPTRSLSCRCCICPLYFGWLLEEPDWYSVNPLDWSDGRKLQGAGLHPWSWGHQRAEPERTRCHLHEPWWAAESCSAELCPRYLWGSLTLGLREVLFRTHWAKDRII